MKTKTDNYITLMELIENYGDSCEIFGDYQTKDNAAQCRRDFEAIKNFLKSIDF